MQRLLEEQSHGVLSTQYEHMPGYPFGSVVPYALDAHGVPVILISPIAQHYQNIAACAHVSLLVMQPVVDDAQAAPRLTWIADALPLDDVDAINRYFARFVAAREYHENLGFRFFRLVPQRICYVGGFGKVQWLDASQWAQQSARP